MESQSVSSFAELIKGVSRVILDDVQFQHDLTNFWRYIREIEQGASNSYANAPINHRYKTCIFPFEGAYVLEAIYTEHPTTDGIIEEKIRAMILPEAENSIPNVVFTRQNHLCKYEFGLCEEIRKYGIVDGALFSTFELNVCGEELFEERTRVVRTIGELFSKNCYSIIKRVKEYDTWSIEYIIYGDKVYVTVTKKVANKQDPEKVGYLVTEKYETLMAKVIDYSFAELDELFNPFNKEDRTRNIGANGSNLKEIGRILSYYPKYIEK